MRGTPRETDRSPPRRRIIPAYAGNTLYIQHADWDDPGSSPRMRGTHSTISYYDRDGGIIPAYAGNTNL